MMPEGLKHGRDSWARRVYHCGCKECLPSGKRRPAKGEGQTPRERKQKLRERKHGKPVPPGTKHGGYTYKTYGCRCDDCRRAMALKWHRRPSTTAGLLVIAELGDGVSAVHWPPVGEGMWECPTCHEKFPRRTIGA